MLTTKADRVVKRAAKLALACQYNEHAWQARHAFAKLQSYIHDNWHKVSRFTQEKLNELSREARLTF